ncbi:phage tail repeat-like family [Trichomonas vaginalis G3]|uniref:phage tail repeat-like family n=1 Tax=Trichomonas vaginalis (strain ATCC PRA-98 / G3) TaxID=412133 RepID=UPI0021E612DE|nr:phage tail repeat-like family [Trichomonas vaginalis G3]KAI5497864.1 phage tail repeat-like family [Trichomonas vaginalis G3]
MPFIENGEIVMKDNTTVSKSVRDILDYLLHLDPTGFDPYTTQCQVPFINDSAEIKLKTSTVDEAIADSLTKLLDIIMRFNTFKTTYETFKKNYDDFFKITYIGPTAPQTPDYACLKINAAWTQVRTLTFDGDNIVRGVTSGDTLLTKEYLKSHISDFVKVEQSGGGKSWLGWLFDLFSAGVTIASLITMQSEIDALWTFLGSKAGMGELVDAARTLGETGNFVDGFKRLVSNVLTNTKKLFRYTVHNGQIFEQVATNPPVMAALMMARDIKPRSGEGKAHEETGEPKDTGQVIREIKNVYPEVIDLFRGVNDSISNHSITIDEENKLTDYIFVIIAELMKRINEKGIDDIINVSDVMMKRNFDSLFTEPKTEYSLYDVITELMKKINDNKSSGGRVELEMNDVNEKLDSKADKDHVHYISSDEQIIMDYHGYLTQDEQISTEDVNERRYKFIRAKGYDIRCPVQYDTGKAPEAFGYNNEIYASYFFVNGVLVEPRFTLRVKAKITFEDAIKSKADKNELDAMNKVLKSHKHNISDIKELQTSLDSKADKNHTHESFTTVRADDIILNYTLGSSAPLENPSTSVKDTLNNLDNKCTNIEGHVRNFETHELPAMLDKKADKNHTHEFFTTIRADEIILNWAIASSSMRDEDMHTNLRDMVVDLANKTDKIYVDEELNRYDTKAMSYTEEAKEWVDENYVKKSEVNEAVNGKINERFSNIDSITVNDIQLHHQLPGQKNVEYNNLTHVLDGFDEFRTDATNAIVSMKNEILQAIYPVGSLYTSMNSTNPASVLGFGTWEQIVDKFLYCANSSKQTGGSKKILEANLPPHKHTGTTNFSGDHSHSLRDHPLYNSDYEAGNDVLSPSYNNSAKKTFRPTEPGGNHSHTFTTNPTGSGEDYMPPYMTVYAWVRTA